MAINWDLRSYNEDEFRAAWHSALSVRGVARLLDLQVSGGSHRILNETADILDLRRDHFRTKPNVIRSLEEILVENSPVVNGVDIRRKLVSAGIKENRCERCGIDTWLGEPAPLSLEHRNGVHSDNRIENLEILCLNCHGLTPTWCGRNHRGANVTAANHCACGKTITKKSTQCVSCSNKARNVEKQNYPATKEIVSGVEKFGYLVYARSIGVSDNTIRKILMRRGVKPLPRRK